MGRFTRIPKSSGDGRSVITGRVWNVIAGHLEGLRMGLPGGMAGMESGVGGVAGVAGRRARFFPWRLLVDENSNGVTVWPDGAFVFGPALDDEGYMEGDATVSPLIPSRYGHPWVPMVGAQPIDVKPYPQLACAADAVTYVWVEILLNERVVVFGKDFAETPGVDAALYGVPVVHADPTVYDTQVVITEDAAVPGVSSSEHSHEIDLAGVVSALDLALWRLELQMITYDIAEVNLITAAAPVDDLTTKHFLVGWVDRTQTPLRIRQFLQGPLHFTPPVFTAWGGTGSTDPEIGLVGSQDGLPPRGESSGDAANSGRGEPV
jgi:hypothetical protein